MKITNKFKTSAFTLAEILIGLVIISGFILIINNIFISQRKSSDKLSQEANFDTTCVRLLHVVKKDINQAYKLNITTSNIEIFQHDYKDPTNPAQAKLSYKVKKDRITYLDKNGQRSDFVFFDKIRPDQRFSFTIDQKKVDLCEIQLAYFEKNKLVKNYIFLMKIGNNLQPKLPDTEKPFEIN